MDKLKQNMHTFIRILFSIISIIAGIIMIVNKNDSEKIVLFFSGIIIIIGIIYSLSKVFSKSLTAKYKSTLFIENIYNAVLGILLLLSCFEFRQSQISNFVIENFKYLIGTMFYIHAINYFFNTSILKQRATIKIFSLNVILISLGAIILASNLTINELGLYAGIFWIVVGVILFFDGIFGVSQKRKISKNKIVEDVEDERNFDKKGKK